MRHYLPLGFAAVSGRMLTMGTSVVAGATVKLYHNVPFGYYLLRSGTNGLSYLAATTPTVKLDVWIQ
ncbi:MAG: hypothetical protein ABIY52_12610 [Gemmatimonadaceae bacterium]